MTLTTILPGPLELLVCYGVCFGLQNKTKWLLMDRFQWLDDLLACSYCTGFHAGWLVWLVWGMAGFMPDVKPVPVLVLGSLVGWTMASAAFCYILDVATSRLER